MTGTFGWLKCGINKNLAIFLVFKTHSELWYLNYVYIRVFIVSNITSESAKGDKAETNIVDSDIRWILEKKCST